MTTSDAPRIWVVGSAGVGKKSLVAALGGVAKKTARATPFAEYAWSGGGGARVTIALCADAARWRGECARRDVVVLVFDVTDRASFDAVARDWATLVSAQTRTLLVGTRLDRAAAERAVAASDAMELALVECDDFVEVCATRPPFEGVVYARQLLATWLSQDDSLPVPTIKTSPLSSPSSRQQRAGVRSSVWLYDPTEEVDVAGRDDVKLRPISRALFEMREAGSDRVKTQERRREQSVAKLIGRSRYHGPTESSRSMRWQAHQLQLQQQQQHARRHSVADVDFRHEHASLESKSFLQPTKLMQQRVDETRSRLLATTEKPSRRAVAKTTRGEQPTRQRSSSTAPPPAPTPMATGTPTRTRAPSLTLSPTKSPRSRFMLQRSPPKEVASDEVALDLLSSPLAPLTATLPGSPARSPRVESPHTKQNNDETPSPPKENQHTISETTHASESAGEKATSVSAEIDDMLDYFDGVTLPL